jgi:hypothetical protein
MQTTPPKVAERITAVLKRFQPILTSAKARDVNEADTVVIVVDLLAELFGYDKYSEITREHSIKSTFCDLALKIDGRLEFLIEVKAIDAELKDAHVKQAVDYAANQGVEWVALTNGVIWRVYRISFAKPIDQQLVLDLDLLALNPKSRDHIECLHLLTRESITKSGLLAYHDHKEATSRFFLAAVLLSDTVVETIRRELRRVSPDIKVSVDEIRQTLTDEVIKRDAVEGPKAELAKKRVVKSAKTMLRIRKSREEGEAPEESDPAPVPAPAEV